MTDETKIPRLWTIRQVAATGLLSEHALRAMVKRGEIPVFKAGAKQLINFDRLLERVNE